MYANLVLRMQQGYCGYIDGHINRSRERVCDGETATEGSDHKVHANTNGDVYGNKMTLAIILKRLAPTFTQLSPIDTQSLN